MAGGQPLPIERGQPEHTPAHFHFQLLLLFLLPVTLPRETALPVTQETGCRCQVEMGNPLPGHVTNSHLQLGSSDQTENNSLDADPTHLASRGLDCRFRICLFKL